jgi:hypothetical protein
LHFQVVRQLDRSSHVSLRFLDFSLQLPAQAKAGEISHLDPMVAPFKPGQQMQSADKVRRRSNNVSHLGNKHQSNPKTYTYEFH